MATDEGVQGEESVGSESLVDILRRRLPILADKIILNRKEIPVFERAELSFDNVDGSHNDRLAYVAGIWSDYLVLCENAKEYPTERERHYIHGYDVRRFADLANIHSYRTINVTEIGKLPLILHHEALGESDG
ncbi:MAG TPA: hypothetical protein VJJ23_03170 [Candidatus Nanoarchaeia archaeon]|nr:hypothetical protein [Candidatus Nanoarchaeia archaeon]